MKSCHRQDVYLKLLQKCAESGAHIELIIFTTGTVVFLYELERTVSSLVGLGTDDKDSGKHRTSSSSKFGPRSHQAKRLRKIALIFVGKASMMDRKVLDRLDVVLRDLHCSS